MVLNIHPTMVHFPIALLGLYSFFEILRFRKLVRQSWYTPVKCAFLFFGTFFGFLAFTSGILARKSLGLYSLLISEHSKWAGISLGIFTLLSICYILFFVSQKGWFVRFEAHIKHAGTMFPAMARATLLLAPIGALIGLIAITITGALGDAIVYGPNIDPLTQFIYHLCIN